MFALMADVDYCYADPDRKKVIVNCIMIWRTLVN